MNSNPISYRQTADGSPLLRRGLACLVLLLWVSTNTMGQTPNDSQISPEPSALHCTHVLGFEGARHNANGELRIQGAALQFQRSGSPAAQVSISSIQNVALGEESKQVGGVPMMLGKTAVPFGGGRVVSLFSHKKYDSLTVEYLDATGGFHGAIFQLAKGQGQTFKNDLIAHGAHIAPSEDPASVQSTPAESVEAVQQWSVQVDRVDPGATTLDPCFSDAIYENLLHKLSESKQFKHVFRGGDRNANVSGVLVL